MNFSVKAGYVVNTFQETFNPDVTILAVDDSKFILAYLRQNLDQMYNIITANSAEEGYAIMEKRVPDMILLDLEMPDIDGYGFLEHVKSVEQYKDIPVVLLTGRSDSETEEKAFALGAADYLQKPITEKLLKIRVSLHVDQILRRRSLEEAAVAKGKFPAQNINDAPKVSSAPLSELEQFFLRDTVKTLKILRGAHENGYPESEIKNYLISVHGIKSTLGSFGEKDASKDAANLESAGRRGDVDFIKEHTAPFILKLEKIVDSLASRNSAHKETADTNQTSDKTILKDKLTIIASACSQFDVKSARAAIKELRTKTWDAEIEEKISKISEFLLTSDFDAISLLLDELMI